MDTAQLHATLAMLRPDDLEAGHRWVALLERAGEMAADEAQTWHSGIAAVRAFYRLSWVVPVA